MSLVAFRRAPHVETCVRLLGRPSGLHMQERRLPIYLSCWRAGTSLNSIPRRCLLTLTRGVPVTDFDVRKVIATLDNL